jgi:hypothetical protein
MFSVSSRQPCSDHDRIKLASKLLFKHATENLLLIMKELLKSENIC